MSKGFNSEEHNRRSIRVKGFDYSQPGFYFMTLVAKNRKCIFGSVQENNIRFNEIGELVVNCWLNIPNIFDNTSLDEFVLMPNHLHGIIFINEAPGKGEASQDLTKGSIQGSTWDASPLHAEGTIPGSVGAIIQNFKSVSTRKVNRLYFKPGNKIWQRNYFERIIRNERELNATHQYIHDNPLNWKLDEENPANL